MAFTSYKHLEMLVKAFQLTYQEHDFIVESHLPLNDYFKQRFQIILREGVVDNSESAICENLIAPILTEAWYNYKDNLFTKNIKLYRISDLEELFGAVNYIF
ncbi:MAG: hypothetical protein F6J96_07030 [Symploca sp. SIO1C2]|nr:hypothetical protein [Symploca sp. SIO1C2]